MEGLPHILWSYQGKKGDKNGGAEKLQNKIHTSAPKRLKRQLNGQEVQRDSNIRTVAEFEVLC